MAKASIPPKPSCLSIEAYENVRYCQQSSLTEKRAYLRDISACGSDKTCAQGKHSLFRKGRLRRGSRPKGLLPTEGLGVLIPKLAFISKTATAFGMSPLKFKKQFELWISYEMKRATGKTATISEINSAFAFRSALVPARQDNEIWFFRHPGAAEDPFEGVLDEWLAARLGLRVKAGEERLAFGFIAANVQNIAIPSFLDASWDYLPMWHWSGKTRPLPGVPSGLDGFEECVADPPELRFLRRPVLAVKFRVP